MDGLMPHSEQLPGYAPVALRYAGGDAAKEELISRAERERRWESILFYRMKLCGFLRMSIFFLSFDDWSENCDCGKHYIPIFVAVAMFLSKILLQQRWQGGIRKVHEDHAGPMQGPPIGV